MTVPPDRDPLIERVSAAYRTSPDSMPDAKERLMAAVRRAPPPRRAWWRRHRAWVVLPLAATLVVLLGVTVVNRWGRTSPVDAGTGRQRLVHFMLVAPAASGVVVVGDFNGWDSLATPMQRSGPNDPWTASVALPPGRRILTYAFIVDGKRWVTDPSAPLAPAGGLGSPTSVLVLPEGRST